jgi:hypothetical protein
MEALYAGYLNGEKNYTALMKKFMSEVRNDQPIAFYEPKTTNEMYSGDIYKKGAAVLHSLRYVMGDEKFYEFMQQLLYPNPADKLETSGSQCGFISTEDLQQVAENIYGKDLDWFFDVYVYGKELPVLQANKRDKTLHLAWNVKDGIDFVMPVQLKILGKMYIVEMHNNQASFTYNSPVAPIVDPDSRILMDLTYVTYVDHNSQSSPGQFTLYQNYPNPFNSWTVIPFSIPKSAKVRMDIFNSLGEIVSTIAEQVYPAGTHKVQWDAKNLPSGNYYYRIQAGDFLDQKSFTLLK